MHALRTSPPPLGAASPYSVQVVQVASPEKGPCPTPPRREATCCLWRVQGRGVVEGVLLSTKRTNVGCYNVVLGVEVWLSGGLTSDGVVVVVVS